MSIKQGSNYLAVSNVSVDGDTISANTYNSLQSIGTVNKNQAQGATNPVYIWTGTYAEFTAQDVANTHPEWLCYITDIGGEIGRVYIAAEVDRLLANKANTDADNFTDTGKAFLAGLGRFSNRFEQLIPVHGSSYTAPANGYFTLDAILANASGNRLYLLFRSRMPYAYNNRAASMAFGALSTYRQYVWIPVSKGDEVAITAQSTSTDPDFNLRFFYAEGEPTISPTYTEVEYIEGIYNTQYIKSTIVTNSSMKLYCKIQNLGSTLNFGWGARNATYDGSQMSISATNQSVVIDWFGASAADRWTVSTTVTADDIFELTIENNVATLVKNGTTIATHTFTPSATITRELYLTGFNNNGALGSTGATGRLYAYKLWDSNDNLIVDMVPAKDGSGVACVYNRVTDTLYYNQGTGTYTAGPEI